MSARGQLAALVSGQHRVTADGNPAEGTLADRGWQLGNVDPMKVRQAAVLMLFGTLDNRPSRYHADVVPDDLDVLLVQRADTLNAHPGQVAFPGGAIDPEDDGPIAAALREAVEETGLDPDGVEVLGQLPEIDLPVSNYQVTPVVGWWTKPSPVAVVDFGESAQVFRVPVADLLNPVNRRTAVVRRSGRTSRSAAFLVRDVVVWGFTGMLLDRLFTDLGWTVPWDAGREMPAPLPSVGGLRPRSG